ncbi:G-type lectin S-receptor-like serine/threonine-protein kinase At1g61420 [Zingiber officinale]|uniref:G-type lectin S-receptor-like serine/threonine-protein kinase At1g61420 n=1 Tax=Zingiber officinale TaxID=94328 RepID=UPI001C4CD9C9|nr:G-type lectin S-receptor-like serine/threonine-protein kinase At1g61420 [Zingiber officinale]
MKKKAQIDSKTLNTIQCGLTKEELNRVRPPENAKKLWDKFLELHEGTSDEPNPTNYLALMAYEPESESESKDESEPESSHESILSRNQSQSEDSCLLNTDRGVGEFLLVFLTDHSLVEIYAFLHFFLNFFEIKDHDGGVILIKGVIFVQGTTTTTATNNFSDGNKLGEGGFGVVYKGQLEDGQRIAVKKLSRNSSQGPNEFQNELLIIAKLQHRNLVRLLGCCIEGTDRLIVLEYMENKSLDA